MDRLYVPAGLLRASQKAGRVNSGVDLPGRQRTGKIARGVRTVRPSFVVTVFVGMNGGPIRVTGLPGWGAWAIPTTICQYKLIGSTDVAFRGISVGEHHGENFSLTCKCLWCSSQATGFTRYSHYIVGVPI